MSNRGSTLAEILTNMISSNLFLEASVLDRYNEGKPRAYVEPEERNLAADPVMGYMTVDQLEKNASILEAQMRKSAKELDFMAAAQLRDELFAMRKLIDERRSGSTETTEARSIA